MLEASMLCFWNWRQLSLLEPYIDKFFNSAIDVCKKRTNHYCEMYFSYLAPKISTEKILASYEDLINKFGSEHKTRKNKLEADVVNQKRLLKSYELCKKYYDEKK